MEGRDVAGTTGEEPTLRDRLRELEWRHATGVDYERSEVEDRTLTEPRRAVRGEQEKVSSNKSDEDDV